MSEAFALALLTTAGVTIIYKKLPPKLQEFFIKYELFTEVFTLLLAYIVLGGTLTALFAASICGLMVSIMLYISKNPDQFTYLKDFAAFIKDGFLQLTTWLKNLGEKYRQRKLSYA